MDEMKALREKRAPTWLVALTFVAPVVVIAAQWFGFAYSPTAEDFQDSQKIMYVHVPAAWNAFLAFFVVFWGSVVYLIKRTERSDLLAASAAEIGAVFTGLTLVLGSIWGRWAWGVWWTWDARLTSTAVLFIIFVGYLSLRSFTEDPERRATWSAGVGIFGALNVPIVYMSVRWWRTLHQAQSTPETLTPIYKWALRANAVAFLLVLIVFISWRYRAARIERRAEALHEEAVLEGGQLHA
ncbi:MAG: cytochrome c biogenesis protein CcsA [Candidatus Longimicrobiales bacterium M2_2A_002]